MLDHFYVEKILKMVYHSTENYKQELLMKKLLAFLLAVAMLLGVSACTILDDKNFGLTDSPLQTASTNPTGKATDVPTAAGAMTTEFTSEPVTPSAALTPTECPVSEGNSYSSRDEVALYIHLFGRLPANFITKSEARKLGWNGGGLDDYAYGCSIGGDHFGNYEGLLPVAPGRMYTECDIDTLHARSRGAKRIVFSNDGLIYYSDDHYETFTLLYVKEDAE